MLKGHTKDDGSDPHAGDTLNGIAIAARWYQNFHYTDGRCMAGIPTATQLSALLVADTTTTTPQCDACHWACKTWKIWELMKSHRHR